MPALELVRKDTTLIASCQLPAKERAVGENRFFHQCMIVTSAALVVVAIACIKFCRYSLPAPQFAAVGNALPFAMAVGYCWWRKREKLLQACLLTGWASVLSTLLKFPMYIAARSPISLKDNLLANADLHLGVEVPAVLQFMALHPGLKSALSASYDLLTPLMILAVVLPAIYSKFTAAKELILGMTFATIAGAPIFALCPAIGPWAHYHFAPTAVQRQCESLLLELHSNRSHAINLNESGIICFPSFHVLLAILSAVALWSIRPLRIPATVIAAFVTFSTLATGWHYVIDVVGGVVLALISVGIAKWFTRIEARFS